MTAGRGPGTGPAARQGKARPGVRPPAAVAARAATVTRPSRPTPLRRLAALGVIAVVLTVLLAPAVRSYIAQRRQIAELAASIDQRRAELTDLQRQREAWDDPAFVKAQARERLKFVMPGERAYTVLDAETPATVVAGRSRVALPPASDDRAWFGTLWRSVQIAGTAAAAPPTGPAGSRDLP